MTERPELRDLLHDGLREVALAFLANDPGITGATDADAVHDARVALRRARSYLRTFARLLERGLALSVRADLKWYAAYLGSVRDLDVIAERLAKAASRLDGADAWPILEGLLGEARAATIQRLRDAEGVARYQTVLAHLELLSNVTLITERGVEASELLERPWRDFRGSVRLLERPFVEQRLHEVRIRVKDLRYAGELVAGLAKEAGTALATSESAVQDQIGEHRDALSAAAYLAARADVLGDASFLAGMLAMEERQRAESALGELNEGLRKVRRRYKRLRRELA